MYPCPPDPRASDNFQLIRNFGAVDFEDHVILTPSGYPAGDWGVTIGEPLAYIGGVTANTEPTAYKIGTTAGHIIRFSNEYAFAGWSWAKHANTFEGGGFPSSLSTGKVPVSGKAKHRIRVLASLYLHRATTAVNLRVKDTAQEPAVGDDVVVVDKGNAAMAQYACLLPRTADVTGAASAGRYKAAVLATPTSAEEALNARIDAAIVGRVTLIDGTYIEIEVN